MPAEKVYAQPQLGHVSLGGALRTLLFVVPVISLGLVLFLVIRPTTEVRVIAAAIMEQTPGAMKLRTLQTIDGLGAGPSNTVVMFPVELTETMKRLVESLPQKNSGVRAS